MSPRSIRMSRCQYISKNQCLYKDLLVLGNSSGAKLGRERAEPTTPLAMSQKRYCEVIA
jgi:hypothetical protein